MIQTPLISQLLSDPRSNMAALMDHAFQSLKPNTLRAYEKAWDDFSHFLNLPNRGAAAARLLELGQGHANALALSYQTSMQTLKLSSSTIRTRIAALKGILNRLRIIGILNWRLEIRGPKVKGYKDTRGPGKDFVLKVITDLQEKNDPKSIRDLAIIHVIYTCGLRRGELASLDLGHLELNRDRLWILGKGRDEREGITIPPKAKISLEAWLKVRPQTGDAVFLSLDNASHGQRLTGNGVWKITTSYSLGRPHGVRHTAITEVIEKTKDLRTAQEFSRHKDLRILQTYDDNRKDRAGKAANMLDEET